MGGLLGAIGGDIISGGLGMIGAAQQNSAQANLISSQDAFQRDMSNTAYQRGTADMKAAGLNPLMMYQSGGGAASSPTGATGTMQNTLAAAANSAKSATQDALQAQNTEKQNELIDKEKAKTDADTDVSKAQQLKINADANNSMINQQILGQKYVQEISNTSAAQAEADARKAAAQLTKRKANLDYEFVPLDKGLSEVGTVLGGASSAMGIYHLGNTRYNPSTTGTYDLNTGEIH